MIAKQEKVLNLSSNHVNAIKTTVRSHQMPTRLAKNTWHYQILVGCVYRNTQIVLRGYKYCNHLGKAFGIILRHFNEHIIY